MSRNRIVSVAAATLAASALFVACADRNAAPAHSPASSAPSSSAAVTLVQAPRSANAVKVEFFVMSQCPFGTDAVNNVKDALDSLGPSVDFTMDFIGQTEADGTLSSMHGQAEVTGDIAQLCAAKLAPDRYLDLVVCQNRDARQVDTNWEACAQETGVPVAALRACVQGSEGRELLKASFARSAARGASGSPTIFVAGTEYERRRTTRDFLRGICGACASPPVPAVCASLPTPPIVNVVLVGDSRCEDCETDRVAAAIRNRIESPNLRVLDYTQPDGRAIYDEAGGGTLPILLFDETLDGDPDARDMVADGLKPAGRYRKLELDGSFNPRCADDGGCKRPECVDTFACRAEAPKRLELFVMSQCPYGIRALDAMKEVLANFKNKIDFRIHYIAAGTASEGFRSLHGQGEVDENIRELCAIKSYGRGYRFMDYILCRNRSIRDTAWEPCATGPIAAARIKQCVETEGKQLHETDIAIATALGIGASPTWVVNGKYKFQGLDAETIRRNVCEHNAGLEGCGNTLSGPDTDTSAQDGCGQ